LKDKNAAGGGRREVVSTIELSEARHGLVRLFRQGITHADQVVSDDAETDSEPMASVQVPAKLQTWGCGSAGTDHFTHLFPELIQGEWFGKKVHTGVKNAGRERPHCVSSLASQS